MAIKSAIVWRNQLLTHLQSHKGSFHRYQTTNSATDSFHRSAARTRNIGMIAHIDAGKTTTTERMLFYSGRILSMGDVDDGDTVTDYMHQERERGITITSASVRFDWANHHINLIDTPGHVDFTFEVERCLSVLDSAVVILDASAGVEAQTLTVWQQANNYDIPKLVYLNKMDKPRADPTYCLQELADLTENPLPIQIAASDIDGRFHGLIDLITMQLKVWDTRQDSSGAIMNSCPLLPTDGHMYDKAKKAREELIGVLSDRDSKFGELILETDTLQDLPTPEIVNAIRRCTIRNQVVPVTIGSSYKNVGVQSLMDTIVRLFPSPLEKNNQLLTRYRDTKLCAFAFKVSFHPNYGPLTFVRIYSGKLIGNSRIYNSARSVAEKVAKIFIPFADTLKEVTHAMPGSIVAISGLNQTYTGDCLMQSREFSQQILHELSTCNSLSVCERLIVHGLKPPKPVYFCSIEAPTVSKQKDLEIALQRLQKEDPSFSVTCNDDTKQMVLNGMGELHLEIIKDRIEKEYKLEPYFGQLQISYRESVDQTAEHLLIDEKVIKNVRNSVQIRLRLSPCDPHLFQLPYKVKVILTAENELYKLRHDRLNAIESGVQTALDHGSILGFPVINCSVELLEFVCPFTTMPSFVSAAVQRCVHEALRSAQPYLLEPIMRLEVTGPETMYGTVLKDLTNRRSTIESCSIKNKQRVVIAYTPLSELSGYSTDLRRLTSGKANLFMQLHEYERMNAADQHRVLHQMQGYV